MRLISKVMALVVLFATMAVFAKSEQVLSVQEMVDQFYQEKKAKAVSKKLFRPIRQPRPDPIHCDPSYPYPNPTPDQDACVQAACDKLGRFGCDDIEEIQEVSKACRGNYDANCLNAVCDKLGRFGCDDLGEIQSVTRACVGNYDTSCFTNVCDRLGRFGCDDMSEVEKVLQTCAGN